MIRRQRQLAHGGRAGRTVLAGDGMPAVLATMRKGAAEIPEMPEIPLPDAGASESSTISGVPVNPPAPGLRRMGLAETRRNRRKFPAENLRQKLSGVLLSHSRGAVQQSSAKRLPEIPGIPEIPHSAGGRSPMVISVVSTEVPSTSFRGKQRSKRAPGIGVCFWCLSATHCRGVRIP
jgi:hypothetical protein